jgi:hypothetical protein
MLEGQAGALLKAARGTVTNAISSGPYSAACADLAEVFQAGEEQPRFKVLSLHADLIPIAALYPAVGRA